MSDKFKDASISDWQVLIVDDQQDNLTITTEALTYHGISVITAVNGIEGLEVLETHQPTLILLDLSMPDMNGWDMFKALRQNPETAHIPVIAFTARAMNGDEQEVMQAGFDGYIPKPFSVSNLILQIQSILDKRSKGGSQ